MDPHPSKNWNKKIKSNTSLVLIHPPTQKTILIPLSFIHLSKRNLKKKKQSLPSLIPCPSVLLFKKRIQKIK
jgi:hypothetical protein